MTETITQKRSLELPTFSTPGPCVKTDCPHYKELSTSYYAHPYCFGCLHNNRIPEQERKFENYTLALQNRKDHTFTLGETVRARHNYRNWYTGVVIKICPVNLKVQDKFGKVWVCNPYDVEKIPGSASKSAI